MVSLLFQNGDTKYHVLGVPKINSICFINSILSTLSGRDRLNVFYQLDFIQVRIDSMCFIKDRLDVNSILSSLADPIIYIGWSTRLIYPGKDRLDVFYQLDFERIDSIQGRWGKRRVSRAD